MDFSSLPPNWQQQPNQQSASSSANTNNNPEAQILQPHGGSIRPGSMADRARMANIPMPEAALKCPRCESTNTKFCYFNNYSLTQPRHLCKTCRRYWTRGGALRNVPVGGGCRRNKRSSSSSSKAPSNKASTAEILHLPALRFMPTPLHHPDFTASGDMGLSYGPADLGFHMTTEQWRLQAPAAQFPFLPADFDGATSSGITQQMASVKMEDSNNQMAGIRHLLGTDHHQYYWNNNSNIIINNYASSATAWTHLSGFSSSSTTSNQL